VKRTGGPRLAGDVRDFATNLTLPPDLTLAPLGVVPGWGLHSDLVFVAPIGRCLFRPGLEKQHGRLVPGRMRTCRVPFLALQNALSSFTATSFATGHLVFAEGVLLLGHQAIGHISALLPKISGVGPAANCKLFLMLVTIGIRASTAGQLVEYDAVSLPLGCLDNIRCRAFRCKSNMAFCCATPTLGSAMSHMKHTNIFFTKHYFNAPCFCSRTHVQSHLWLFLWEGQ
jgi:hypothetical protein